MAKVTSPNGSCKQSETSMGNNDTVSQTTRMPFRFHRYRAELAKRQQQESRQPCEGGDSKIDAAGSSCRTNNGRLDASVIISSLQQQPSVMLSASSHTHANNLLENVSHATITVHGNGNVDIVRLQPSSHIPATTSTITTTFQSVDLQTTLLLRNLQHCNIVILNDTTHHDMTQAAASLPALHIVNVAHTQIDVQVPVATAVHVTKAVDSHLCLPHAAQQLRIHQASRLQVTLRQDDADGTTWNKGSIILEHSKHVTFCVPSVMPAKGADSEASSPLEAASEQYWISVIKDFGWLRAGIPSPNFVIQTILEDSPLTDAQRADSTPNNNTEVGSGAANAVAPKTESAFSTQQLHNSKDDSSDQEDDDEL